MLTVSTYEADIGTIVLNNASKRNALDDALVDEVVEAFDGFRRCKVRVVVLRAPAGSKVWSAGRDVAELPQGRRDPLGWSDPLRVLVRAAVQEFPAPLIALIEGSCQRQIESDPGPPLPATWN